jgi:glycosyltransferase involved in cell wall biosynthesis
LDEVKRTIEQADMVTVTTNKLAEAFLPYNQNIKILPNCVDISQWNRLNIKRDNPEEIRIGWAGGYSHWEDLHMIREPLIEIGRLYPNVKIIMIGYMPITMEKDFRPGQLEFFPWVDTAAHPYRMAAMDLDISLVPIKNNIFNVRKSPIKWIEFSSLRIPCVSSYISPYREMCDLSDSKNGIYIEENDKAGWVEGIKMLVESKSLRDNMGNQARMDVENNFDINKRYGEWIQAYEEVLGVNSIKPAFK